MNKKRWVIVALAILLVIVAGVSSIGTNSDQEESESQSGIATFFAGQPYQEEVVEPGNSSSRILRIPIEGTIGLESATYNHETIMAAIDMVEQDQSIEAVVLSVDSPGGTVYHSRDIYDRLQDVKEETDVPVYASMGSQAASGGYYVSMPADRVFAAPETITGSIGVILQSYNVEELMDNLGIEQNVIKSGEMKDILSSSREMTDEEEEVLNDYIDESFNSFVQAVASGRSMEEDRVRELADGRIYSGQQAVDNGLVDEIGYERDALDHVREEHNLEDAEVIQLTTNNQFGSMFSNLPLFKSEEGKVKQLISEVEEAQEVQIHYMMEGVN